jgi:Predicted membrane protein
MRTRFLTLLSVFLILALSSHAQMLKAGAAIRDITPDHLIPISGGMGTPVMPTGFQGKLTTRAMVLEKGKTRVAIVSVDNIGWPAYLGDRSRKLIKGIAPENILIGATHAHSCPEAYGFADEKGNTGADRKYLDWCVTQIADAVNEAVSKLEPVSLKTAVEKANGQIAYNYYAPELYDKRMGVIQAIATSGPNAGKPVATLVNYATHPEILGTSRKLMSPDLCGPLYDRIESKIGGVAIFMNSAQGGMVTADTRVDPKINDGKEHNDWNECIRIGNLMADEALRIIEKAPVQENPTLYCAAKTIRFPIDNTAMRQVFKYSPLVPESLKKGNFSSISTQLNLINIGKAQIITIPGEALPNIGFYVKRKMNSTQPMLFGLTNDAFGYMLTKEDFGGFERYNYVSRTSLGEMTGVIYEDEAIKFSAESPGSDK